MRSLRIHYFALSFLLLPLLVLSAYAGTISLGTAGSYAVLAGSTVTNTGPSVIYKGDVGVSPGTAITGFPPGIVNAPGTIHSADAAAAQAQLDLTTAYITAAGLAYTTDLTGQDLGGMTLTPGVYFFKTSAQLTGALTLDNSTNQNAVFIFQIGTTLTTASFSYVGFLNGIDPNVFWQVGTSATLGTSTAFAGNILALDSVTLNTTATIDCGSALARNGAVTLDNNDITSCGSSETTVPEPGTLGLLGSGLAILAGVARRRMRI